jgi:hypothetical protein
MCGPSAIEEFDPTGPLVFFYNGEIREEIYTRVLGIYCKPEYSITITETPYSEFTQTYGPDHIGRCGITVHKNITPMNDVWTCTCIPQKKEKEMPYAIGCGDKKCETCTCHCCPIHMHEKMHSICRKKFYTTEK